MSKILIIANEIPYPPHKNGVCSTLYNYISCWSKSGHDIDLIYLIGEKDVQSEAVLKNNFGVKSISNNISGKEIIQKFFGHLFIKPRNSWHLNSKKLKQLDCASYAYILVGSFSSALVMDKLLNVEGKIIFFEADSGSMYYERNYVQSKNLIRKLYLKTQIKCISRLERILYKKADITSFVSTVDYEYANDNFEGNFLANPIAVEIPVNCIKTVDTKNQKEYFDLGFSGIMDYEPNMKTVDYIIEKIMPELDKYGFDYKMHIIGKNPSDNWKESAYFRNGKLVITGFLDSIEKYIQSMDIYISPLFLGSGMKNKILQAMGIGVPMICSEVSVEGINELVNGVNYYLASENEREWCKYIYELCIDKQKQFEFSESCKEIIYKYYSWDESARRILGE